MAHRYTSVHHDVRHAPEALVKIDILVYRDDELHCLDGPAIKTSDGSELWWQFGKLHRDDGPAVVYSWGVKEYWLRGELKTKDQYITYLSIERERLNKANDGMHKTIAKLNSMLREEVCKNTMLMETHNSIK